MATTTSQHRAQLLREMNKTRSSSGSSRHSESPQPTISNFDPDNEAMMSTRQLENNAQKLPELRASAQKYKRQTPFEPDYVIDTSAIGRAFPDFSQDIASSDDSISIEIGRGVKGEKRNTSGRVRASREYSSNADIRLDEDTLDLKDHVISNYALKGTPPRKQNPAKDMTDTVQPNQRSHPDTHRTSGLRHQVELSPPEKAKDYGSGESRKSSGGSRRGIAAMHARVREEKDVSHLTDERPPTTEVTVRNTRFGSGKIPQNAATNNMQTKFSSSKGLSSVKTGVKSARNVAMGRQDTRDSFMLPEMPNISELVSGVFEDGTPVFSRHSQSRVSRFISGEGPKASRSHTDVDEIPLPNDEQAIFLSLKLLQDKVAILEREKAGAETMAKDLEEKNRLLESEKLPKRRTSGRSDSALGITDSDGGDEMPTGSRREDAIQRNRLETSVRNLQNQVDASNRKAATAETILNNITHERDSAVNQLSVAFVTIEQLKAENQSLKEENQTLKNQSDQHARNDDHDAHERDSQEALPIRTGHKIPRATATSLKEVHSHTAQAADDPTPRVTDGGKRADIPQTRKTPYHYDEDDSLFDLTPRQDAKARLQIDQDAAKHTRKAQGGNTKSIYSELTKEPVSHPMRDCESDDSRRLTHLSLVNPKEIESLRKTIEQERLQQKRRVSHRPLDLSGVDEAQDDLQPAQNALPPKSSTRVLDDTGRSVTRQTQGPVKDPNAEPNRRHSETSMLSTRSRRREVNTENMTSAFILPDITIRKPNTSQEDTDHIDGQPVERPTHEQQNCMICKRDDAHEHGTRRETITISRPVPVSERVPPPDTFEGDQTLRPAQTPALALATVLKGLEDELVHLKIKLEKYQALYNCHDPALSKRKRKAVQAKIEILLQTIDVKSDQIYALYDVLEGQKQNGQDLTEEQVEVTLQSIGVDPTETSTKGKPTETQQKFEAKGRHTWDLSSDEGEDEEMPWEGIESTVETTRTGHRRRASAA